MSALTATRNNLFFEKLLQNGYFRCVAARVEQIKDAKFRYSSSCRVYIRTHSEVLPASSGMLPDFEEKNLKREC